MLGSAFDVGLTRTTVPLSRFTRSRRVRLRLTTAVTRTIEGYRVVSDPDVTIDLVRRR